MSRDNRLRAIHDRNVSRKQNMDNMKRFARDREGGRRGGGGTGGEGRDRQTDRHTHRAQTRDPLLHYIQSS